MNNGLKQKMSCLKFRKSSKDTCKIKDANFLVFTFYRMTNLLKFSQKPTTSKLFKKILRSASSVSVN